MQARPELSPQTSDTISKRSQLSAAPHAEDRGSSDDWNTWSASGRCTRPMLASAILVALLFLVAFTSAERESRATNGQNPTPIPAVEISGPTGGLVK